jgi:hypothetical protein
MKQIVLWIGLIGSLTGCQFHPQSASNEYFCVPELAYRLDGVEDDRSAREAPGDLDENGET